MRTPSQNIDNLLNQAFENTNYLPQKLLLEDIDQGLYNFLKTFNLSLTIEDGTKKQVPVIFLTQEKWAEFQKNWKSLRNENNEEIGYPFLTLRRTGVKKGTSPQRYTIPNKKKFSFVKVPNFDGVLKGLDIYKVPQPTWVDCIYEFKFFTHYMEEVNSCYEMVLNEIFSSGEGYMNINGYYIGAMLDDPSEENNMNEILADRRFSINFPIKVHAKLVDPSKFEKVNSITKISINISER
jgi:hypothetical protein